MARVLMTIGALLVAAGAVVWAVQRFLPGLGRLPGDIVYQKGNFTFYFPIATCVLLSLLLSLLSWLLRR